MQEIVSDIPALQIRVFDYLGKIKYQDLTDWVASTLEWKHVNTVGKHKSTVLAVQCLVNVIWNFFDCKGSIAVLLRDLSHALDSVPHKILLQETFGFTSIFKFL